MRTAPLDRARRPLLRAGRLSGALACLAFAQSSCGGSTAPADAQGSSSIAFAKDFSGFRAWPSRSIDSAVAAGSTHVSGPRTVFIKQPPPPEATEFPVGTLIVKETAADGKIFARCKRGGGFNTTGAVDWEWFELQENVSGEVGIKWRGFGPPAGEMYGGDATGGCNGCHTVAKANDYVLSPWLALGAGAGGSGGSLGVAGAGVGPETGGAGGASGAP